MIDIIRKAILTVDGAIQLHESMEYQRTILAYKDGELHSTYKTATEASKVLGINHLIISKQIRGEPTREKTFNFEFEYRRKQ